MPKGYWIGRIDVIKPEYTKAYGPALAAVLRKYDAKFRVRGGTFEAVEGKARDCNIVIEFKDYETALACYRSPEYTKARALREAATARGSPRVMQPSRPCASPGTLQSDRLVKDLPAALEAPSLSCSISHRIDPACWPKSSPL